MVTMLDALGKALYERDIYGFVTVDFIAFPDPFTTNENPLFWANGLSIHYSCFNTICSLTQAATGYFEDLDRPKSYKDVEKRRIATCLPFITQRALPTIHFRSFFHLARLDNMFYDISTKRGIIFLIADSLQAGAIGLVSIDYDLTGSYQKLLRCLDFLRKQNVESHGDRYKRNGLPSRGDTVEFGDIYGGVKIVTKELVNLRAGMLGSINTKKLLTVG